MDCVAFLVLLPVGMRDLDEARRGGISSKFFISLSQIIKHSLIVISAVIPMLAGFDFAGTGRR